MRNIVLIGMPGTGKSTVGVILAKEMGMHFLDTDILLCETEHRRLPEIIEQEGFEGFIVTEGRLGETISCENTVIATGGSMVFSEKAMENLSRNAVILWLDTPVKELEKRIMFNRTSRGVAAPDDMSVSEIYEMRRPLYERWCDHRIRCAGTSEQVVMGIKDLLKTE